MSPTLARFHPVHTDDLVRVGSAHDGGYVINERCLARTRVLVGIGISTNWEFEEDFLRRAPQCRVVGIDHSVSPTRFLVRGLRYHVKALWYAVTGRLAKAATRQVRARHLLGLVGRFREFFGRDQCVFVQRRLGTQEGGRTVVWGGPTLEAAIGAGGADHGVFLKVDIEGAEYATLPAILRDARRFCAIAAEFHDCGNRWDELLELLTLMQRDFVVVHVHGNNYSSRVPGTDVPRALEVTFLHRALLVGPPVPSADAFPRAGLDTANDPRFPDYALSF